MLHDSAVRVHGEEQLESRGTGLFQTMDVLQRLWVNGCRSRCVDAYVEISFILIVQCDTGQCSSVLCTSIQTKSLVVHV